ncbi:hypothetical protein L1987_22044 [Smallanthus sonchifolius]|uniref:Uncharacterized protein n=1 Tax=Smallanthus sonchifolius TaxID=185202 RepID=A0ACB9IED4_9ASTR|nr:hypothetical protein L1987_22044 [Smallanthus sonchifolius]
MTIHIVTKTAVQNSNKYLVAKDSTDSKPLTPVVEENKGPVTQPNLTCLAFDPLLNALDLTHLQVITQCTRTCPFTCHQ